MREDEDSAKEDCKAYKSMFPEHAAVERYDVIKIEIEKKHFWDKIKTWKKIIGQLINGQLTRYKYC